MTEGGISFIRSDGSVVDVTATSFTNGQYGDFTNSNRALTSSSTGSGDGAMLNSFEIPNSDKSGSGNFGDSADGAVYYRLGHGDTDLAIYPAGLSALNHHINAVTAAGDIIAFGREDDGSTQMVGVGLIKENIDTPSEGLLNIINTDYQSGWMAGDIKGAWLADSDDSDVGVDETTKLVTNGDFASDSDWTKGTGWTIGSGVATHATGSGSRIYQNSLSLSAGEVVDITVTVSGMTAGTLAVQIGTDGTGATYDTFLVISSNGTYTCQGVMESGDNAVGFYAATTFDGDIDDVSIKQTGNLVVNGTFDSDISGWTATTVGELIAWDAGRIKIDRNGGNYGGYQEVAVIVGETYTFSVDVAQLDLGQAQFSLGTTKTTRDVHIFANQASPITLATTFVATTTSVFINLWVATDINGVVYADNITLRLADIDRSVNGNGLQVNGTITKTALGGDGSLVACSGYSAANYFKQPYSSDLDFGTDDFYLMGWLKEDANSSTEFILARRPVAGTAPWYRLHVNNSGFIDFTANDGSNSAFIATTETVDDNVWRYIAITYTNSTGLLAMYFNGKLVATDIQILTSMDNAAASLMIGVDENAANPLTHGSLALWRIGAGAPSSEDIEFIYKQEKPLIVNGARATLGGSSDAITSLAWDDYKKQLYAQSGDTLSTIQGSTVVATEASTADIVVASDGEIINE